MARGGFHLRKWACNHGELLHDIPPGNLELVLEYPLDEGKTLKVLGITWLPSEDSFKFIIKKPEITDPTKRSILSLVARLFDLLD